MSQNYDKLKEKLKEIFQLNQADLDFGIYRIMNTKRDEILRYLDNDLKPQVKAILETLEDDSKGTLEEQLQKAIEGAKAAEIDPDTSPKVKKLREQMKGSVDLDALEKEIFSDLYNFFSRYYEGGDFLSLRRYKEGVYAIPYEGEEVKLHWANSDQYYIKTSEYFTNYSFKLADGKRVHFRLVKAGTEQNNNKAQEGKDRRFMRSAEPVRVENDELIIPFEYKPDNDKRSQKDINQATVTALSSDKTLAKFAPELLKEIERASGGNWTLLEKRLNDYTSKNEFDYFIHKDLGGFMRRELDFFIKNEILHLDDMIDQKPKDFEKRLAKLKALKSIGHKIITFLAQLEDFQKKLWLKKKFVVETNWCITLDRVPEELYAEIAANEAQKEEWIKLFAIDDLKGYGKKLSVQFLKDNPYLVLDTAFFSDAFKAKLLAQFNDIDDHANGLLLQSDNFQALDLIQDKYRGGVKTIFIDPPYNTEQDRQEGKFVYKDGFSNSSWIALMYDRVLSSYALLNPKGLLFSTIDDNEVYNLKALLDDIFGSKNFKANIIWNSRKSKQNDIDVSLSHNYVMLYSKNKNKLELYGQPLIESEFDNPDNDPKGKWKVSPLDAPGIRERTSFFDIVNPATGASYSPPKGRHWTVFEEDVPDLIAEGRIFFGSKGNSRPQWKRYWEEVKEDAKTIGTIWDEVDTATNGTKELENILGHKKFETPKPISLLEEIIQQSTASNETIIDYFAGSGTTVHATISMNRKDGGNRKYIAVEMGDYFDEVTMPRIKKSIYSKDWKRGVPVSREGASHSFKYVRLESYEDALNNLRLNRAGNVQGTLDADKKIREQYILNYMLDIESKKSVLNLDAFIKPFDYQLMINRNDDMRPRKIDLVETFNYLIGLHVERMRFVDDVYVVSGKTRDGKAVLILWRDAEKLDAAKLDKWFDKNRKDLKASDFDLIYVNGDNTLQGQSGKGDRWTVKLIEEAFHRLMFNEASL